MRTLLRIAVALEAIAREMQKANKPASAKPSPTPLLKAKKPRQARRVWTKEELRWLDNYSRQASTAQLAKFLKRTQRSVEKGLYMHFGGVGEWKNGARLKTR